MFKAVFACILFGLLIFLNVQSQPTIQSGSSGYSYYPPSKDKESWQRLYLLLSSTYINVANEGQVDLDTCLYKASSSLGLSRFPILAEGFGDPDLSKQSQWIDQQDPGAGILLLSEATGRKRLQLLLLLGSYYAFQQKSHLRFRDSVEYFLTQAINESKTLKEDKLRRHALCLLGKMYVQANEKKGDSIYNLLIDQSRKAGDKETEAKALVYRSRFTPPMASTIEQKLNDSQQAADLYHSLGNIEGEINALTDAGYLLTILGRLQTAREVLLKAYSLAESIHFPYMHYCAHALSTVTMFQGKFGEPFRYALQMVKVAESCRDSIGWGYFHTNLAYMLKSEGRDQESLAVARKAIEYFVRQRNPTVYNILGDVIYHMNKEGHAKEALDMTLDISKKVKRPATFSDQFSFHFALTNCYLYLKQLALAEMHLRKMDSLETEAEVIRGPLNRTTINELTGLILMEKGQYKEARQLIEKRFTSPGTSKRTLLLDLALYETLFDLDSILGDNVAAVSHYKKYVALLDSSFRVTKVRQAEELQILYEVEEKENQISLLTQQAKLEKDNSEKAALLRNLTIAGIFAVIIIAALLYRQNRLKQKSNQMITRKNEQLQDLLADKEWLLKEIHHRVKNNLQIVISLLNSQSAYIDNDVALTAINDSQRRMHAMALIHQKLYLSENISTIAMPDYINEQVRYVQDSFGTASRIVFEQNIEPLELDVSQAIPLGLIINEGIVNAIKYAFPNEGNGIVCIDLYHDGPERLFLEISDNGVGLPLEFDIMHHNSLGFDLMKGLAKQLNGSLSFESNKGLKIMVEFIGIKIPLLEKAVITF